MKKIRSIYFGGMLVLLSAALLGGAGCSTLRRAGQESDRDFYRTYSKKMGVSLNGTEEKELIRAAAGWLGVPYRYGGQNRKGVDCSALVGNLYREAYGVTLPRTSSMIAKQAKRVKKRNLACGDLLFFTIADKKVSHMGMYLANDKFLHASTSKGVSVASLSDKYWSKYFSGAGRIHTPGAGARAQAKQPPPAADEKKKSAVAEAPQPRPSKEKPKDKPKDKDSSGSSGDVIIVFDEEF
ncbi:MAG: C40 family peptidase [Prevotellaceae bacterium]|jgi:hypothetical protein|nr:C40 family peptidase [Prevotellaceae bacterium]